MQSFKFNKTLRKSISQITTKKLRAASSPAKSTPMPHSWPSWKPQVIVVHRND